MKTIDVPVKFLPFGHPFENVDSVIFEIEDVVEFDSTTYYDPIELLGNEYWLDDSGNLMYWSECSLIFPRKDRLVLGKLLISALYFNENRTKYGYYEASLSFVDGQFLESEEEFRTPFHDVKQPIDFHTQFKMEIEMVIDSIPAIAEYDDLAHAINQIKIFIGK